MQQITRRAIPGERFRDLPGRPLRRGMGRHVEVDGVTSMVSQRYEDKQQVLRLGRVVVRRCSTPS
jgi:hypothetical protein